MRYSTDKVRGHEGRHECEDWDLFFPPETRVLALPNWRRPRLFMLARNRSQRWEDSALYPASRARAKAYRSWLKLKATVGLTRTRMTSGGNQWPLQEFTMGTLPTFAFATVLVGTPGPAQGLTVQLRDEEDRVLGYLKYVKKTAARKRLHQERSMLLNIPEGIGPELMKFGPLEGGEAILKSPLAGEPTPVTLPPPNGLFELLRSMVVVPPLTLEEHPWVERMQDHGAPVAWFEILAGREWPVVIQHGDFVPWNLLIRPDGAFQAVDWEYGIMEGFPHLDLAHYLLQTSALIHRRSPAEALRYTVEYLSYHPEVALNRTESEAIACLAAYSAYRSLSEDGLLSEVGLQPWRRAVWESAKLGAPVACEYL